MAGAARWIDQLYFPEAELADGRIERAFENESLDELGRLEQRVAFARRFREVLVEVAEKARIDRWVGEVMHQDARVRVHGLKEADELHRPVAGQRQAKEWVVLAVEQAGKTRQSCRLIEADEQIIKIGISRF